MTRAPQNLLAVRRLLLAELSPHGLASAEVGIVGDANHRGGYHCGEDRVVPGDYSVVESPRDSAGLTLDAAALDVGLFEVRSGGRTHNLRSFSVWCVGQCAAGAADTRDIREIIYSPDGRVVRRWDRLGRRSTGDSSHLWHTHFSFFRDSIKAGRDQRSLFRRYLTTIGLIDPEDDVTKDEIKQAVREVLDAQVPFRSAGIREANPDRPAGVSDRALAEYTWHDALQLRREVAALTRRVEQLAAGGATVDVDALATAVADKLAARLAS